MSNYIDAADFGFLPEAEAEKNVIALQLALDYGGTIRVDRPGTYRLNDTVTIGSNTSLEFGEGVFLQRAACYSYTLVNKGAFTRTYDRNIKISGMKLVCNNFDQSYPQKIPGLNAHVAFFYVTDLVIRDFQCLDLPHKGFCLQICTFENIRLENLRIEGMKDAVHLGNGRRFTIRHGIFRTFDDPIALNAYDYSSSNPQFGWIEDGIIEDCHDLDQESTTGFFCRMLAGSWREWFPGMEVRFSDLVASRGRIYSVNTKPDGMSYHSFTPPMHEGGSVTLDDGIVWRMVQDDTTRDCAIRNIHFKDIFLRKKRDCAFCMLLELNQYARSIYPGAAMPVIQDIILENIFIANSIPSLIRSNAACSVVKVINSVIDRSSVDLEIYPEMFGKYPVADFLFSGTTFRGGNYPLMHCESGRTVLVNIQNSIAESRNEPFLVDGTVEVLGSDIKITRTQTKMTN